jgi:carboxyl-terminal processing protease
MHRIGKYSVPIAAIWVAFVSFSALRADEGADATNLPSADIKLGDEGGAYQKIELLTEILMQVKRNYVEEKMYTEIVNGAIHGMLQALDPHSDYLDPKAYTGMKEDTRGTYGGVGIHIGMKNDILTVIAPIEDAPAFKAGMLAGDRIIAVDEVKTRTMKFREAVDKIRGKNGTTVVLTVVREGETESLDFELKRGYIELSSVKGTRMIRDGIGYIRITQFSSPTAASFQSAMDELLAKDMKALVLDLRNNPGGLVRSSVSVAQKFLKEGELIVTTKGRKSKKAIVERRARGAIHYLDIPIVILVNEGSASAAEIVAGALQDQGRAVLLGQTTYGKGSVQSIVPLRSEKDSAIRLTTAKYYTPSGNVIHGRGIEPDIFVYVPRVEWLGVQRRRAHLENEKLYSDEEKKQYASVRDRQLERATDLLDALMTFDAVAGAKEEK